MATVFQAAKVEVVSKASFNSGIVRDPAYEAAFQHFTTREFNARRLSKQLGVTERTARSHIARWRERNKVAFVNFGRKNRSYRFTT